MTGKVQVEDVGGNRSSSLARSSGPVAQPGNGTVLPADSWLLDPGLAPYREKIARRTQHVRSWQERILDGGVSLGAFASGHEYYGLHFRNGRWIFRELAPNATGIWLVGDFSGWRLADEFALRRTGENGDWEITLPADAIGHGQHYRLEIAWPEGRGERLPSHARRVVQDPSTGLFAAQVWHPDRPYAWRLPRFRVPPRAPLIYEAHVGMAQSAEKVGTFDEFRRHILPRVVDAGYNTLQLMALMEHPYYGSFGYQVSNFFAASSRFGTPEELKALVDEAHQAGLAVIMDLVHSHAVRNEREGLSLFDGTGSLYFHRGSRGWHDVWDSRCFDYGRVNVMHFLLSNCRYWLDEFHFDGFRFDGVTSMLYLHHGLGVDFVDYGQYFDSMVDEDAFAYLALANRLVHELRPDALTIAEDVSGMPGLAAPLAEGGAGFDYRMAMGVPECWFKLVNEVRDEDWSIGFLWHELINRRQEEKTINYVECHDQSLVGGKSLLFAMLDAEIYQSMHRQASNPVVDRGIALHKMIRLATIAAAGHGYLNFIGNEFGHPEWIDFPREGNGFSYHHARRLWHLRDDPELFFHCLADFDREMLALFGDGGLLGLLPPRLVMVSEPDKVLAFSRGPVTAVFNFHADRSLVDYPVPAPPGRHELILDTDALRFGGQGRIAPDQVFLTRSRVRNNVREDRILLYLPARVALVVRVC